MADGFLGRWSQRKQAVREGKTLEEPVQVESTPDALAPTDEPKTHPIEAPEKLAPPTLQDVQNLSSQSDFIPFVARDVAPEVRNAAMKKLFADPHYNVMDGLDIYIDDYSKPDPLPLSMLRQMASAKFLNLFDDDPEAQTKPLTEPPPPTQATDHDNTDLRLQQDDAVGPQQPGRGTE